MGCDAYLMVKGVAGESSDKDHAGWIELLEYDFSIAQKVSTTASSVGGATAERSDFTDFTIVKQLDKSSPLLVLACAEGRHIDTVILELSRAGKVTFMTYRLTDCMISSVYAWGDGEFPEEKISINFGRLEIAYRQQTRATGLSSGIVAAGWDRVKNCKV